MALLTIGDAAPDFDLPSDGKQAIRLSALCGKPVVLYFYPSDGSETCTAEAIEFSRLMPAFKRLDAAVVGISPDSAASHGKFRRKHGLKVGLAADEDRATIEGYGVWADKVLFGRRYMGVERSTFLIDAEGRISRIWRKVRIKGHAEAVLDAVKAL